MNHTSFYCCNVKIFDHRSFETHYLNHQNHYNGYRVQKNFKCPFCGNGCTYYKNLKRHFQNHHYDLIENIYPRQIDTDDYLDPNSIHSDYNFDDDDDYGNYIEDDRNDLIDELLSSESSDDEDDVNTNQFGFIATQTVQCESSSLITEKNDLTSEISDLILFGKRELKMNLNAIINFTKKYNEILSKFSTSDKLILNMVDQLVKNPYQIKKTLLQNNPSTENNLIKYEFESTEDQSLEKKPFFYYLPITTFLNKILSTDHIMEKILAERMKPPCSTRMRTFKDAQLFSEQKLEGKGELVIHLQAWHDDFSSSKRNSTNNKYCIVLLNLNNLPLKNVAKRSSSFLAVIGKRKYLNEIGIDLFLKPLLDDIKRLDDQRLTYKGFVIRVKITQFAGDNLAIHELMKLTRCFRKDSCRFCMITYQQLQKLNPNLIINERLLSHDHCLHGTFDNPFSYAVDIFHDLCHGVIIKLMAFILIHHYKGNYTELINEYNKVPCKHGKIEKINKSNGKITGTGMQILDFFILFGFLDKKVNRSSVYWRLYLLLRSIVLFCFHPVVYSNELDQLHKNIIDFQLIFFNQIVFPTKDLSKTKKVTFTMKVHYIIHYVKAIILTGPLLNSCTLKQERCITTFNNYLIASNNRKNQAFSIATWFLYNFDSTAFTQNNEYKLIRNVKSNGNCDSDLIRRFLNPEKDTEFIKSCHSNDVDYKIGNIFLFDYSNDQNLPTFIKITHILKQENTIKVIGLLFKTLNYCSEKCVYEVIETNHCTELNQENLEWHQPLYFFENKFVLQEFKPKGQLEFK